MRLIPIAPILILLLLATPTLAAELHGSIYTIDLELAQDVLIEVNTTPAQRMLSTDGTYAFSLGPGTYAIVATYIEDGKDETSTDQVIVTSEGDFIFDLFLLPDIALDEEELIDEDLLDPLDEQTKAGDVFSRLVIVALILGFLILAGRLLVKRRVQDTPAADEDDAIQEVLKIIQSHGGRITQKELRKELPHSEAKISLVVAELEAKGRLQKIKKGRGNILVLRKV